MDPVVKLLTDQLVEARERLRVAVAELPRDRDLPETLAYVRDAQVVEMATLAKWAGLGRTRLYELLAIADREHES